MKLSRKFRRKTYKSHRRKIDLFASGTTACEEIRSATDDTRSLSGKKEEDSTQTSNDPRTVKEAFEAFKRSCQDAS